MIEHYVGACPKCGTGLLVEETALNGDVRVRCKSCQPLAVREETIPLCSIAATSTSEGVLARAILKIHDRLSILEN